QRHLEDSVLIRGAHLTCVHAGRKRDAAAERANIAFGALSFLAAPAFSLALALIVSVPSCKEMSMSSLRIPGNSTTAITLSLLWQRSSAGDQPLKSCPARAKLDQTGNSKNELSSSLKLFQRSTADHGANSEV